MKTTKYSSTKSFSRFADFWARRAFAAAGEIALILLLGASTPRLTAQSYNFNSGNDSGWTHYNLQTFLTGGPAVPPGATLYGVTFTNGYNATPSFTFPPDGAGGYHYRIQSPAINFDYWNLTPIPGLSGNGAGPSRAASYPSTPYTNQYVVGVDIAAFNPTWNHYFGPIALAQNIGLGTSIGYGGLYGVANKNLYLHAIVGEQPNPVGRLANHDVVLKSGHQYRLVMSSHNGQTQLLQLFDKSQPTNSPWLSVIAIDATYYGQPGVCGLLTYNYDEPPPNENPGNSLTGTDATFDNYDASAPAANQIPSLWPATVTDLYPPPGGNPSEFQPTVKVGILDRETQVNSSSIVLYLDGSLVPNGSLTIDITGVHKPQNPITTDFAGATVTYLVPSVYPAGSVHSTAVVFSDDQAITHSNYWTWTTVPTLWATNSLAVGSLTLPGFDARMVQSAAAGLGGNNGTSLQGDLVNCVASAQAVLAGQYTVDLTSTNWVQLVAWANNGTDSGAVTNFPGLCIPPANTYSFAVEAFAYLRLTAGQHTFYVDSDDAVGIYSGTNLKDTSNVLVQQDWGGNTTFNFFVEADGLYPFLIIYEEGHPGAHCVLKSGSSSGPLVNDLANGGIPAFYPLAVKSATAVAGPYTVDAAANAANALSTAAVACDGSGTVRNRSLTGGTITLTPAPGAPKYYRLDGPRVSKITSIQKSGADLVINFNYQ